MVRVSNLIICVANAMFMAIGLVAIGFSIYVFIVGPTQCQRFIQNPLLITGTIVLAISTLGLIGTCYKSNTIMFIYLLIVFLSLLFLIGFSVFVFLVTNQAAGKAVSGKGFKGLKTGDVGNWLGDHFVSGSNWRGVRDCLAESRVCKSLGDPGRSDFYSKNLSPVQSGCCMPPPECGYESTNATWWTAPRAGPATTNSDCTTWSNVQNQLCFSCNSCKAGFLANVHKEWRNLLIFNVSLLVLVIFIYSFGCCARWNNTRQSKRHDI